MLVLAVDEFVPGLFRVLPDHVIVLLVESHVILVYISVEFVGAEDLGDLHELVVVVLALEEGLLLEDHACEHAAEGPNVERVVVGLQVNQQFGPLEVPGSDTHIILLARVIELSKTPIDESELAVSMINHDVVWLHVSVSDALRVAEVKSAQHLENVVADVEVIKVLVEGAEIYITCVHILHDQGRCLGHGVPHHINQVDYVDAALQGLQNLDLTADLRLLHWLQDLDDYTLASGSVDALVHLGVLAAPDFLNDFVVFLRSIGDKTISAMPTYPNLTSKFS